MRAERRPTNLIPLIDGDMLLYRNPDLEAFDDYVCSIMSDLNTDKAYVFVKTDDTSYRREVLKDYKANRPPRDSKVTELLEAVKTNLIINSMPQLETDDYLSIFASTNPDSYVIVSDDKDFDTIPGLHMKLKNRELYKVSKDEACLAFQRQLIIGDSADNVKGLPRKGPVYANNNLTTDLRLNYYKLIKLYEESKASLPDNFLALMILTSKEFLNFLNITWVEPQLYGTI